MPSTMHEIAEKQKETWDQEVGTALLAALAGGSPDCVTKIVTFPIVPVTVPVTWAFAEPLMRVTRLRVATRRYARPGPDDEPEVEVDMYGHRLTKGVQRAGALWVSAPEWIAPDLVVLAATKS
jgi:hypothetical protein